MIGCIKDTLLRICEGVFCREYGKTQKETPHTNKKGIVQFDEMFEENLYVLPVLDGQIPGNPGDR